MGKPHGETRKRPWTTRELALLRDLKEHGAETVALLVGRTPKAVQRAAERAGWSLHRAGTKGGRPRRRRPESHAGPLGDQLCTQCATALAERDSGWCWPCLLKERAAGHEADSVTLDQLGADAQRLLDRMRKRKQRSIDRAEERTIPELEASIAELDRALADLRRGVADARARE